jgi:hypothetical protein
MSDMSGGSCLGSATVFRGNLCACLHPRCRLEPPVLHAEDSIGPTGQIRGDFVYFVGFVDIGLGVDIVDFVYFVDFVDFGLSVDIVAFV